jgi:hypothetical protein
LRPRFPSPLTRACVFLHDFFLRRTQDESRASGECLLPSARRGEVSIFVLAGTYSYFL